MRPMFPFSQAAEKEAAFAQQEEEKAEQRKRARAEKKALKKKKKTRGADKRKAEEDDEKEWGDDEEGRAFWKCYLGTSLTSRGVTDTIQRTSVLSQLRISCSHGAPSPFLSLPVVHVGVVLPLLGFPAIRLALPCSSSCPSTQAPLHPLCHCPLHPPPVWCLFTLLGLPQPGCPCLSSTQVPASHTAACTHTCLAQHTRWF